MTIILGIDPGSQITGFGLIDAQKHSLVHLHHGYIRVAQLPMVERLQQIFLSLTEIIRRYTPQEAAIEQVFMHANPGAALTLGQARGAAMTAVGYADLGLAEYTARQVKQSLVGYGAANKVQMQAMICHLLNLVETPQVDAADALAIAVCHAHHRSGLAAMIGQRGRRRGRSR